MDQSLDKGAALAGTIELGDLTVNRLGFGAMRLCGDSAWGRPRDPDNATRVLHRALELGVNFIDTADSYGPEVNESLIAQALHPYPPGLVIATKGGLVRPNRRSWVADDTPTICGLLLKAVCSACGWSASICISCMRLIPTCHLRSRLKRSPICSAKAKFAISGSRTSASRSSNWHAASRPSRRFRTRTTCETKLAKTCSQRASALGSPFCPGIRWVANADCGHSR